MVLEVALPEVPVWVQGDATRLTQVLANLLQNALKFGGRGGRVTVRVGADAGRGQAVLAVRDTGSGIAPDMLPRLFEPFAQADRSLDRSRGGLGLGLALVKGLVELHGGAVQAESEGPGRGARFTLRLPLARPPVATGVPLPALSSPGPLRILVVEDNRDAAESLQELLELVGCTVAVAYDGFTAVDMASQYLPEVLLCD